MVPLLAVMHWVELPRFIEMVPLLAVIIVLREVVWEAVGRVTRREGGRVGRAYTWYLIYVSVLCNGDVFICHAR